MSSEKKYKLLEGDPSDSSYKNFEKKIGDAFRRFYKSAPFGTKISEYLSYRESLLKSKIASIENDTRQFFLPVRKEAPTASDPVAPINAVKTKPAPTPAPKKDEKKPEPPKAAEPLPPFFPFIDEAKELPPVIEAADPRPAFNYRPFIFAGGIALVLALLLKFALPQKAMEARTDLPYTHVIGPVVKDNAIYAADWFRSNLYVHKMSKGLPILAVESIPNTLITGFAVTKENLWTIDGANGRILQHATTPEHLVLRSFPVPGKKGRGLFYDGTDLWSGDDVGRTLFQHQGTDVSSIKNEFHFNDIVMMSFQVSQGKAWMLDRTSKKIFCYSLATPMVLQQQYDLKSLLEGAEPRGFAIKDDTFLVSTENPAKIIRISFTSH